jgi:hypothetical protein
MSTGTTASTPAPLRRRRWFALLGGAIAWFVHLIAIFLISEFGCVAGLDERLWANISVVAALLLGASVIPLVVAIAAAIVGYRDRQSADWLAQAGALMSGLFALIIAVQSIPALFYVRGC